MNYTNYIAFYTIIIIILIWFCLLIKGMILYRNRLFFNYYVLNNKKRIIKSQSTEIIPPVEINAKEAEDAIVKPKPLVKPVNLVIQPTPSVNDGESFQATRDAEITPQKKFKIKRDSEDKFVILEVNMDKSGHGLENSERKPLFNNLSDGLSNNGHYEEMSTGKNKKQGELEVFISNNNMKPYRRQIQIAKRKKRIIEFAKLNAPIHEMSLVKKLLDIFGEGERALFSPDSRLKIYVMKKIFCNFYVLYPLLKPKDSYPLVHLPSVIQLVLYLSYLLLVYSIITIIANMEDLVVDAGRVFMVCLLIVNFLAPLFIFINYLTLKVYFQNLAMDSETGIANKTEKAKIDTIKDALKNQEELEKIKLLKTLATKKNRIFEFGFSLLALATMILSGYTLYKLEKGRPYVRSELLFFLICLALDLFFFRILFCFIIYFVQIHRYNRKKNFNLTAFLHDDIISEKEELRDFEVFLRENQEFQGEQEESEVFDDRYFVSKFRDRNSNIRSKIGSNLLGAENFAMVQEVIKEENSREDSSDVPVDDDRKLEEDLLNMLKAQKDKEEEELQLQEELRRAAANIKPFESMEPPLEQDPADEDEEDLSEDKSPNKNKKNMLLAKEDNENVEYDAQNLDKALNRLTTGLGGLGPNNVKKRYQPTNASYASMMKSVKQSGPTKGKYNTSQENFRGTEAEMGLDNPDDEDLSPSQKRGYESKRKSLIDYIPLDMNPSQQGKFRGSKYLNPSELNSKGTFQTLGEALVKKSENDFSFREEKMKNGILANASEIPENEEKFKNNANLEEERQRENSVKSLSTNSYRGYLRHDSNASQKSLGNRRKSTDRRSTSIKKK